ncbi:MAG: hypothetical protein U9R14_03095 [Patescibacteria group bacterium]|nr:hypothetical protein [Patescibacteria group bacterium]
MQQFTIPQFIDVEDKIIGPITTRQFIIMLSGFMLIGVSYKIFDFSAFLFIGIIIFAISGIFAFVKINSRPFHFFVLNLIQTLKRANLRVWNHTISEIAVDYELKEGDLSGYSPVDADKRKQAQARAAKYHTASRLAELALMVDTRGAYSGEDKGEQTGIESV